MTEYAMRRELECRVLIKGRMRETQREGGEKRGDSGGKAEWQRPPPQKNGREEREQEWAESLSLKGPLHLCTVVTPCHKQRGDCARISKHRAKVCLESNTDLFIHISNGFQPYQFPVTL